MRVVVEAFDCFVRLAGCLFGGVLCRTRRRLADRVCLMMESAISHSTSKHGGRRSAEEAFQPMSNEVKSQGTAGHTTTTMTAISATLAAGVSGDGRIEEEESAVEESRKGEAERRGGS